MTRCATPPPPMSGAASSRLWEEMPDIWRSGAALPTARRIFSFPSDTITMSRSSLTISSTTGKKGKKHHIIVNAEGIGHSASMAKRIEAATGVETRQRSWATCSAAAAHLQRPGIRIHDGRLCGGSAVRRQEQPRGGILKNGAFVDYDIDEALAMKKDISAYEFEVSRNPVGVRLRECAAQGNSGNLHM